jgi:Ca-activated chloride channel homolog
VRKVHHKIFLLVALVAVIASPVFTQSQKGNEPDEPLKLSTQLVVVDAQILNKRTGMPVDGLSERDFVVYEEGGKQQITHFSQDKLPLSIVLLLDVSGSVALAIDKVRESGLRALNELKPGDEVALMAFGEWATVLQDFTKDRNLITAQLAFLESMGPWIRNGTYIDEAVYSAAKYLSKASNPNSRRIIVIVTDNLSNQPPNLGHSESEALVQLHASGAALCGLIVGDFNAVASAYKRNGLLLRDSIANFLTETGGILSRVDKENVTAKLALLIERLRSRYSLGYTPLNIKRDGKFRNIKLKVSPEVGRREGDVTIVARKGYYAPAQD